DGVTPVSDITHVNVVDLNNQVIGIATYDDAATVTSDGIWLGYNLIQLTFNPGQTLLVQSDPNGDNTLLARLTGSGNVNFSGSGVMVLQNPANDYSGNTTVSAGTLQLAHDQAMGHTADVALASGAGLDLAGRTQDIGSLHGAAGSTLTLNGGVLNVAQGGDSAGALSGAGTLNLAGGTLAVHGANSALTATTQIAAPAVVTLDHVAGLGSGNIVLAGELDLQGAQGTLGNTLTGAGRFGIQNQSAVMLASPAQLAGFSGAVTVDSGSQLTGLEAGALGSGSITNNGTVVLQNTQPWAIANPISGNGSVTKTGAGTLVVDSGLTYSGNTRISAGTLQVGTTSAGRLDSTGTVTIDSAGTLTGLGTVAGSVINNGLIKAMEGGSSATLAARQGLVRNVIRPQTRISQSPNSNLTIAGDLANHGLIDLTGSTPGNTLTINGNYSSNGGQLRLNTTLGNDASATDQLIVHGSTAGATAVSVNNLHGAGEQTVNGIKLVQVDGASAGTFTLQGRAVAGAYEYYL
ncbi:autotransporter outer membrane beta-barrel domain-containing protein, partial [Amantichitinum ursilacus]|uniref:autotransporter outer membrane beta-barrel domain-containing protein n=1 Tax=Amantichitinum ursilacus TaxID=857265 RepID=UPI000A4982C8